MPLTRSERFMLKSQIVDAIRDEPHRWTYPRQNLLLREFGFPTMDLNYDGPDFGVLTSDASDGTLIDLFRIVTNSDPKDILKARPTSDHGQWKPGYVKLFLSHSALHKAFAGQVADELAVVGIHAFVAHDTMEYSKPWQTQIEQALQSMDVFAAIVHPEFLQSSWCQQEVGWALGAQVPRYVVRHGVDPAGFIGREQWPSGHGQSAKQIATLLSSWVSSMPTFSDVMIDGLFSALETAGNYIDAGATASRIATLKNLTLQQWNRLDAIYWNNDQLQSGALPTKALRPFYHENQRVWPPARLVTPS